MRQTTKYLGLDIAGVTDEPSLITNYVTNMVAIDEAIHNAEGGGGGEAVDQVARDAAAAAASDAQTALNAGITAQTVASQARTTANAAKTTANAAKTAADAANVYLYDHTQMGFSSPDYNWVAQGSFLKFGDSPSKMLAIFTVMPTVQVTINSYKEVAKIQSMTLTAPPAICIPLGIVSDTDKFVDVPPKGLQLEITDGFDGSGYVSFTIKVDTEITIEAMQKLVFVAIFGTQLS